MFVRKPVAPADLREFVALGLLGERVSAETAARERANSAAARTRTRKTATTFVARIRREVEQRAAGQMAWLAAYFGLETALTALMDEGRLTVSRRCRRSPRSRPGSTLPASCLPATKSSRAARRWCSPTRRRTRASRRGPTVSRASDSSPVFRCWLRRESRSASSA